MLWCGTPVHRGMPTAFSVWRSSLTRTANTSWCKCETPGACVIPSCCMQRSPSFLCDGFCMLVWCSFPQPPACFRGHKEWNQKWADTDTHSWTRKARHVLQYNPDTADANDGYSGASVWVVMSTTAVSCSCPPCVYVDCHGRLFWIDFQDFCQHYASLYMCRTFDEPNWHA